jgi:hypothetical protein
MRTLEHGTTLTARIGAAPGLALVRVNDSLWRVVRPAGELIGYVELVATPGGTRYRAKRFLSLQRRVLIDGEFWDMDDAVDCFRTR